jgi:hypothetical protein
LAITTAILRITSVQLDPHGNYDVPSFAEKYPKIKYAIFDRPHWQQLDLCETSFLLLNGSH